MVNASSLVPIFITEHFKVHLEAVHYLRQENMWADALSRNNLFCFQQAPNSMDSAAVRILDELFKPAGS